MKSFLLYLVCLILFGFGVGLTMKLLFKNPNGMPSHEQPSKQIETVRIVIICEKPESNVYVVKNGEPLQATPFVF